MQRRDFLRLLGAVTATPLMGAISELAYGAGPFNDYRALVCVMLPGGNDTHNMIVPLDGRFAAYSTNRGPLAIPQSYLQVNAVIDPLQGSFGFHPRMPKTAALFKAGVLAVQTNVGPLIKPTSKIDYTNRVQLPPQLFSHSDMTEYWHTAHPQAPALTGWGGRLGDLLQSANNGGLLVSVSTASSGVLLKGNSAVAHQIGSYSATQPNTPIVQRIRAWRDWDVNGANAQAVYQNSVAMTRNNLLEDQFGDVATRSIALNDLILASLYNGPAANGTYTQKTTINTPLPTGNSLAAQLRSVAMTIAARQALGVQRQIFFVSFGGTFDTHSDQYDTAFSTLKPQTGDPASAFGKHADQLGQLDDALKFFYDVTSELGVQNSVTTFTESDFGRTLTSNGKGSDHGWGSHHMIIGGAVKGGNIYGTFHNMQVGAANPVDAGQGRLIPAYSVDQYAATLAQWIGATPSDLATVFPNLQNFGSLSNLGFMR
jgi:uncharacterized protein (DUF1501 family)